MKGLPVLEIPNFLDVVIDRNVSIDGHWNDPLTRLTYVQVLLTRLYRGGRPIIAKINYGTC
jgi:hypothetical protein